MGSVSPDKSVKEKLIRSIKKEVKQIMEEAVTKKFVHEDSGTITSLCASVEIAMSHGLKRRALGLFKSSSTTALLHKVAKTFQPAAAIVQLVAEIENCDPTKRSSSGSESASKLTLGSSTNSIKSPMAMRTSGVKYLWIRVALVEKLLAKIIDYVVQNSSKYYEKEALVSDAEYGSILGSLLVGPCALDFSKLKTGEHMWTDPPADELIQRHRISSGHFPPPGSPPIHKRPALHYKGGSPRTVYSSSDDTMRSKDYVESLHQNNRSTLLYGKNNVIVYLKDAKEPLAGYLSLHQCGDMLNMKWTPNELMNGSSDSTLDKSSFWEYALNLLVHEIVYIHCHQGNNSDWIVLVGQDGVQRPPVHFPRGGHLLAFLSCLENGLLPHGMLDPPLWSQSGKGKVFPKLKRKGSRISSGSSTSSGTTIEESYGSPARSVQVEDPEGDMSDFVFRLIYPNYKPFSQQIEEMLDEPIWKTPSTPRSNPPITPRSTPLHSVSTTSSTSSSKSLDQQGSMNNEAGEPIQNVCQTMKKQIISRAFYGWLAHCRHLRTIRTHLIGLVQPEIVKESQVEGASEGLTEARWKELQERGGVDIKEVYKIVYFGGMSHSLRKKLWPLLLAENLEGDNSEELRKEYENKMSEWLAVEAIVRQKDKETMAANLAKLSSEGGNGVLQKQGSNEVFENEKPGEEEEVISIVEEDDDSKMTPIQEGSVENYEEDEKGENGKEETILKEKEHHPSLGELGRSPSIKSIVQEKDGENSSLSSNDSSAVSSSGGVYSNELLETFALNLHRIEKDVKRCDRNYWYFTEPNLDKLRNVMCTYVWENLEMGYVQGMCDLAAPLLVILDDEAEAFGCFRRLMKRMGANFPSGGGAMDAHFANMRSLLQVLDQDLFALIRQNGDYTHFYFCYRWFLLDFKREFSYDDIFLVWETIWSARHVASGDYGLFLALALLNYYRDIVLSNSMDFTDIIKFFNEMAERHNAKIILQIARNLVLQLHTMIENK